MSRQEFNAPLGAHNRSCSGRLSRTIHLDGDTWYAWAYSCPGCGGAAAIHQRRKRPHSVSYSFTPAETAPQEDTRD